MPAVRGGPGAQSPAQYTPQCQCPARSGTRPPGKAEEQSQTFPLTEWVLNDHAGFGQIEVVLIFRDQPPQLVRQVSDLSDLPLLVISHSLLDSQPEQLVIAQNGEGALLGQ